MSCSTKEKPQDIEKWVDFYEVDSIPELLEQVLIQLNKGEFSIGNPNENYNKTDVVLDSLPMRQLKLLSKRNNEWRIGYVQGGFGKHYYFAQCTIQNDSIFNFKFTDSNRVFGNNDTIDKYIKENKISLKNIVIKWEKQ